MAQFRDLKIRIESAEQSMEVQEILFQKGYEWPFSGKNISWTHKPWLSTSVLGTLRWHGEHESEDFWRCTYVTLNMLRKGDF